MYNVLAGLGQVDTRPDGCPPPPSRSPRALPDVPHGALAVADEDCIIAARTAWGRGHLGPTLRRAKRE
eukprot:1230500-Alexandrium_andersonii.AAC.1